MTIPFNHPMIRLCVNDATKRQVNALNEDALKAQAVRHGVPDDDIPKLIALQNEHRLSDDQIRKAIVQARPYMGKVFDIWKETMSHFTLTSVGIAIGHANIKKSAGEFTNLSIWIN